jgi:DNA polymerase sigma
VENTLKRYCNDLHAVIQYITEPKQLKEAVKALYQKHVLEPPQGAQVDVDIQKEYNRQRDYLEKTVDSLKRKLSKYAQILLLICTHAPVSSSSYEHTHSCP